MHSHCFQSSSGIIITQTRKHRQMHVMFFHRIIWDSQTNTHYSDPDAWDMLGIMNLARSDGEVFSFRAFTNTIAAQAISNRSVSVCVPAHVLIIPLLCELKLLSSRVRQTTYGCEWGWMRVTRCRKSQRQSIYCNNDYNSFDNARNSVCMYASVCVGWVLNICASTNT